MNNIKTRTKSVMFTDIVSSSKISQENLREGIKISEEHLSIVSKYVDQFDGVLVKDMGDGTLSYFYSSVDAVRCAIAIMDEVLVVNKERKNKWHLRIGIHIGEIFIKENDILGNTVNIASHIESNADSDSIFISHDVYKMVENSISLSTIKIGAKEFKNIKEKHILYKVLGEATEEVKCKQVNSKCSFKIRALVTVSLIIILFFVIYVFFPNQLISLFKNRNPYNYTIDSLNSELRIYNFKDELLWRKKMPQIDKIRKGNIIITDIQSDGINEVIIGNIEEESNSNLAQISCYDYEGSLIWKTPFDKKVHDFSKNYYIKQMKSVDINNDGHKELIVAYNHIPWWPAFLTVIDNKGNFLYQVMNAGHIDSIAAKDIDNDGVVDVFAGGVNNILSLDKSAILMYINGKRVFDNDRRWEEEICMAPIQDSLQTVDGYFYPQKSIFNLLSVGEQWMDTIGKINIMEGFMYLEMKILRKRRYNLRLDTSFVNFQPILHDKFINEVKLYIKDNYISEDAVKKYLKDEYIYPSTMRYWDFETMRIDTLFVDNF